MDLTDVRNVLAIEKYGSITRAARELRIAQPNLSKSIKDLEKEFGIVIFERSVKGVQITMEGQRFITFAKKIQQPVDDLREYYNSEKKGKASFRISFPRASYIASAYKNFVKGLPKDIQLSLSVLETNSGEAIRNIVEHGYELGIIRFNICHEEYFMALLKLKNLEFELVLETKLRIIVSQLSPLARLGEVHKKDLKSFTELVHGDSRLPNGLFADVIKRDEKDMENRIYVYERGIQFDLLNELEQAYMWVSPMPRETLERNGLVEIRVVDSDLIIKDCLVYARGHAFDDFEKEFISELKNTVAAFRDKH